MGKLTDLEIRALKPKDSAYTKADGGGLTLEVHPNGGRYWRYRFRDAVGKGRRISLGTYPDVTLAKARERHQAEKTKRNDGVDLVMERLDVKHARKLDAANTFESLARAWHGDVSAQPNKWKPQYAHEILRRLENHVFPEIGAYPVSSINPQRVLMVLKGIEVKGTLENAKRVKEYIGQALRWGVQRGLAQRDFTHDLKGALASADKRNHPRVDLNQIPELLQAIQRADLYAVTHLAIDWLFLTAARTGEMRGATWSEIDIERARWTIPAGRMKMETQHIVPLSKQALEVLEKVKALGLRATPDAFIFPAMQHQAKMMSENTIGYAFNRMGYHGRQSPHGIRGLFSTYCNESARWEFQDIEMCLSHQTGNEVSRAYNSAQRIPQRARLMQWWADELDAMRGGRAPYVATAADVITLAERQALRKTVGT